MDITFLRHAALPRSEQKKFHGWSNISIDEELFKYSKVEKLKEEQFDFIISSDLQRCTQTLNKMGLTYKTDKRLREICFNNEIEGKSFEDVESLESYSSEYLHSESSWHGYVCKESKKEFQIRLRDFLSSLPKGKILVCSHKGAIVEMLSMFDCSIKNLDYLEYIGVNSELQ